MRWLLDVNVLIALFLSDHLRHQHAHGWSGASRDHGWASCPLMQNGLVRIIAQSKQAGATTTQDALRRLQTFTLQTDHAFWPDSISLLDEQMIDYDRVLGPNQLTDIYLLTLAVKNGGRLVTFDTAIPLAAVPGARAEHLVVI